MYYIKIKLNKLKFNNAIFKVFKGILDHYNEKLYNAYSNIDKLTSLLINNVNIINENVLIEAIKKNKGIILATGHFGGIEFLPSVIAMRGYSVSIMCRFKNTAFSKRIKDKASIVGINLIETDKPNTLKYAIKALRNGGILVTECDEFFNNKRNTKLITFLGHKINYDRTIDILQKRSGATVLFGLVKRKPSKKYELILYNDLKSNDDFFKGISFGEKCLRLLENAIYFNPEQWYQWKNFGYIINHNKFDNNLITYN